jgi:hypothetical protein
MKLIISYYKEGTLALTKDELITSSLPLLTKDLRAPVFNNTLKLT